MTSKRVFNTTVKARSFEQTGLGYEDLRVAAVSTNAGGSQAPTFTKFRDDGAGSQGVFGYSFVAGAEKELYLSVQLPHSWRQGTDVLAHVHFSTLATTTGTVIWGLEYTWANVNGTYPTTTLSTSSYDITANSQYKHMLSPIVTLSGSGKTISSVIICRVYRTSGGTNTGAMILTDVDFHYQTDTIGSSAETSK